MKENRTFFILSAFLFMVLLALSACNLGNATSQQPTPTTAIMLLSMNESAPVFTGPGEAYVQVDELDAGQQVEAVGSSPDSLYWLIRHPGNPAILVWLPASSAAIIGTPINLPIATPPPTPTLAGLGCPSPVPFGPTPVSCEPAAPPPGSGCPSPVPFGPTPVSCEPAAPPPGSGCPSPVPYGPTPVSCEPAAPPPGSGCPSPVPYGPTPVSCEPGAPPPGSGCPSPVPSGPTPVTCP